MRSSMLAVFLILTIIGVLCSVTTAQQDDPASIPSVDPKLFNKHRYFSPRVLFSAQPPDAEPAGLQGVSGRIQRNPPQRGVFSVCQSISTWVTNKTTATDIAGNEVTVIEHLTVDSRKLKQYFYETSCHDNPSGDLRCLGIDERKSTNPRDGRWWDQSSSTKRSLMATPRRLKAKYDSATISTSP
ncbi:PREDICTED: nerve growth factor-like [Poecilia mexicana]|uniref:nerve growth factor-like n=1 Tax=Poecilia mexicana TaxID=48701 RepID=UPI00072DDF77|nr:PREDICTED: nerve growth factor-like [Poecilia mexicana]